MKSDWILEVVKSGIKPWSKDQWVKHLPDSTNSFGCLAAFDLAAENMQRTSQAVPRTPVMREFRQAQSETPRLPDWVGCCTPAPSDREVASIGRRHRFRPAIQ